MPDMAVFDKAEALAKLQRSQASTPFSRDADGLFHFADIPTREQTLLAVREIYTGEFYAHLDPFPGETFNEAARRPGKVELQHMKRWVNQRSGARLYAKSPVRRFYVGGKALDSEDRIAVMLGDAYRAMQVNDVMAECANELELYGNVVLRVTYDKDFNEPVLDRFISPRVRVVENDLNPKRPYGTVLTGRIIERRDDYRGRFVDVAEAWVVPLPGVAGGFRRFGGGNDTGWQPLATPYPPLVHCFASPPTSDTGYYVPPLGVVLAKLNVLLNNDFLSRLGYTVTMQAHGQLVLHGHDGSQSVQLGPGRALGFSGSTNQGDLIQDAKYIQPGADIVGLQGAIEYIMREIREVYQIPPSEIDVGQDASGRSRIEARAPSMEFMQARRDLLRRIETELVRAVVMALGAFDPSFPAIDPSTVDVVVAFEPQVLASNVAEQIALEEHDLKLGLVSAGELMMRRKPDSYDTLEEASAAVDENMASMPEPENPEQPENTEDST